MFSIIIPLFNESKNIKVLLAEIKKNLVKFQDYEIILVNDASSDDTIYQIKKIKNKSIKLLNNSKNEGQSFSLHRGIKESKNNTVITIDGDGQNDPADIPKLLNLYLSNKKIMLVGGIRLNRKDNLIKIFSSKIANHIRSRILNDNCVDTGCSLKVFNRDIFLDFPYFNGMHRFLPALYNGYGYRTEFINVNHRPRKYGVSKYGTFNRLFKGISDIIKVINILKNRQQ